ncbi:hypothetical protein [Stenotrophomonas maltophilia]|uniref:DNA injection protein n=1 Tax=Stenotrophomonas maltophilia TaxID=40324 RepID=A0AAJ2JBI2_STEMA|nr:hypothetical protein [Stenotrophomonas maltophilia]MDT3468918.1 hypothetical protein [Stenotrophomonas maltophilia]
MANALTGNFGPLAAIGYVQEQGDIGRQRGQQNRLNMLTGQAYSATTPQDQSSLLGQIAQISPQAAQAQQQQFQSQEDRNRKELYGLAQGWKKIPSQYRQNYYDRFLSPRLSAMGMGEQPAYDEASIDGAADQIIAAFGQNLGAGQGVQSTYVDEGGNRVAIMRDGSTQVLGRNDAGANQQTLNIDVNGVPTQVTFDRRTGRYTNANLGAPQRPLQQIDGQPTYIDPSLPPQVQAAIRAGAGTNLQDGGQLQVAQGMPLVGRRKEDEAAAVEAARQAVQLGGLPQELGLRTDAAINQAAGIDRAKSQQERASGRGAAEASLRDAESNLDRLSSQARALMINPGLPRVTGALGAVPDFPGSQAANARAEVETLKSQVGFGVLQAMREASKTGGALGAVSDTENRLLQSNLAALDSSQSPEAFRANLQKIVDYVDGAKGRMRQAFQAQYQGQSAQQPSGAQQRTIVRRGTSNGRSVVQYSDGTIEYGN